MEDGPYDVSLIPARSEFSKVMRRDGEEDQSTVKKQKYTLMRERRLNRIHISGDFAVSRHRLLRSNTESVKDKRSEIRRRW